MLGGGGGGGGGGCESLVSPSCHPGVVGVPLASVLVLLFLVGVLMVSVGMCGCLVSSVRLSAIPAWSVCLVLFLLVVLLWLEFSWLLWAEWVSGFPLWSDVSPLVVSVPLAVFLVLLFLVGVLMVSVGI